MKRSWSLLERDFNMIQAQGLIGARERVKNKTKQNPSVGMGFMGGMFKCLYNNHIYDLSGI